MAIILKKDKLRIKLDSNKIIGIMGRNYYDFINSFNGDRISYINDSDFEHEMVVDELKSKYSKNNFDEVVMSYLTDFNYEKDFLSKKISELSDSAKRILKYLAAFLSENTIILVNNVYQDLDYFYKKKIKYWLKKIVKDNNKTIIIGSNNSEDIYDICQKVLLIGDNYIYGDINKIMENSSLLKKYDVNIPKIVQFVDLCREKKISINYTSDIRDLIKEVYKNV